jgi:hypothetical protein
MRLQYGQYDLVDNADAIGHWLGSESPPVSVPIMFEKLLEATNEAEGIATKKLLDHCLPPARERLLFTNYHTTTAR